MTRTMTQTKFNKIPKYPRYDLAKYTVTQTILKYANNNIPISLTHIANQFNDLVLRSYGWYQNKMNVSKEHIITKLTKSEDGGLLRISDNTGKEVYFILYDESKKPGRKRFTIAHELGHYFLKHHQLIDKTVISRGEITDKEYGVLEKEANYFARLLLVPLSLLPYISSNWGAISTNHLMDIFNVTYSVASNVLKHINKIKNCVGTPINKDIVNKYKISLNKYINVYICHNCHAEFIAENPECCPMCKKQTIKRIMSKDYERYYKFERSDYMIYSGIEIDENSKAIVCPICGNEEPSEGDYCPICGTHLVNRCINPNCPGRNEYEYEYDNLGAHLPGNARYCTYCGYMSTFFVNKLLKPWQVEKQELETKEYETEAAPSFEFSIDDIPF